MSELPQGEVNFLFTQLEASAMLWEKYPQLMQAQLGRHDAIIRQAVANHDGYIFQTLSDSLCAAFASAQNAAQAALAIQRSFAAEHWRGQPLRVKVALHCGAAELRAGEYFGPPTLNRMARILAVTNPGQILLSAPIREQLPDSLADEVSIRDLGERRLRDLAPQHIYQLVAPDLPDCFPPLKSLDARPSNLPAQSTSFIGRQQEQRAVAELLRQHEVRLLTLSGPGGTGKTRLSIQVAANLLDEFTHGAWFVPLAAISDPALVASTIAETLGLTEQIDEGIGDSLKRYVADRQMLLVVDNFEQVVEAGPLLEELLAAAPQLKVLVSSRELLHLHGEHEYQVPPLALPDLANLPSPDALATYPAVNLFVQRAQAVRFDFALTAENAAAVAEICARLDGLPLAIELAAARIRILNPSEMLTQLDNRLALLTGGSRERSARQQSLRGMIDWSYDLLDDGEKQLFVRLAVFVGGCTIQAAEEVCNTRGDLAIDVAAGLASLADKSLLRHISLPIVVQQEEHDSPSGEDEISSNSGPRFTMLETIREYALEKLRANQRTRYDMQNAIHEYAQEKLTHSGEDEELHRTHANYYMTLAEQGERWLDGPMLLTGSSLLEREHDNLRAALRWAIDAGEATIALRTVGAMMRFWSLRSHLREGRDWTLAALQVTGDTQVAVRAKALYCAGELQYRLGDWQAARQYHEQGLALWRSLDDKRWVALTITGLANAIYDNGDYEQARALYEESIAISESLGDEMAVARGRTNLGIVASDRGDYATARRLYEQALITKRRTGSKPSLANTVLNLGYVIYFEGDYPAAESLYREALSIYSEIGFREGAAFALEGFAMLATAQGSEKRALRLFAAEAALRDEIGSPIPPTDMVKHEERVVQCRTLLGEQTAAQIWEEGLNMTFEQMVHYAMDGAE